MQTEPRQQNPLALAFVGDAVYEVYIRRRVMEITGGASGADMLHRLAVKYVCAAGQAKAVKTMIEDGFLAPSEEALLRRAHNHKIATKPKNADPMTYKWATAFEALIGCLYLEENSDRMEEIITRAIELIEA